MHVRRTRTPAVLFFGKEIPDFTHLTGQSFYCYIFTNGKMCAAPETVYEANILAELSLN